jgi:hypothetical protein
MYRIPLCLALLTACNGAEDADPSLTLDPVDPQPVAEDTAEPPVECGPTELCTRSTQECGYAVTVAECSSWYDQPGNCADMPAYTECNCGCIGEDTCDAYYSCGELCFADHC